METRLFEVGTVPPWTTPEWYAGRDAAPHIEQEGHRDRLLLAAEMITTAITAIEAEGGEAQILDLGAGDGGLLSILPTSGIGFDLQQSNVDAAAARGVDVRLKNIIDDPDWEQYVGPDTVLVALELLEHLLEPHRFVERLAATQARWLVVSSPYTETADNHYEYHTWAFDLEGYRALMEDAGWKVVECRTAWISQTLMCQR